MAIKVMSNYLVGQVFATFFTVSGSFPNTQNLCSTML